MIAKRFKSSIGIALCLVIFICWGNTFWIHAKARLAQHLISNAWAATMADQKDHKPWSWADTWPIAELRFPQKNTHYYILEGSSGNALAFSPGHITQSAKPGEKGTIIISGHRDTHFAFLQHTKNGDILELENRHQQIDTYIISDKTVVDVRYSKLEFTNNVDELKLVTCYPFEAVVPGGPLRLVVSAKKINLAMQKASSPKEFKSK